MTKNIKYFFIFLFLLSCGYTPIYQIKKDSNFKIDTINFSGDKNIGREIIRGLKNFEGNDAKNIFDLDLNTSKQESIVSKDKKGNATSYKLVLTVDAFFTNKINNKNYQKKGYPYELKGNCGKNWSASCKFCFYKFNNKILHTVAQEMPDKNFA